MNLILGDCLVVMQGMEANSIDAIVTDPPYGLSFMGKKWDYDVPSIEIWKEALRVLKPGGHLLCFGGTRTYHRTVLNIEDAGFEVRDQLQWLFGQGFPKSLDVSKAIDRAAGAKREVVGSRLGQPGYHLNPNDGNGMLGTGISSNTYETKLAASQITAPSTDTAKQWEGWGTALKPANEPILLARKPISEKTVAANILKWGTGALNIDACRIGNGNDRINGGLRPAGQSKIIGQLNTPQNFRPTGGRFPSNLLLDEQAAEMLGPPARFFYCAKVSKSERDAGLDGIPSQSTYVRKGANNPSPNRRIRSDNQVRNHHPTVKPIKLMAYLCRLITPPNGIILDPFMGSGSTGIAALKEDFKFVGIEKEAEYFEIAKRRCNAA